MHSYTTFESLLGKVFTNVEVDMDHSEITFIVSPTEVYKMCHVVDCCETVFIKDITGDITDLIGAPILLAEEATSNDMESLKTKFGDSLVLHVLKGTMDLANNAGSFTWTFYKMATIKGYVDIQWYGESNGYYSESADVCRII